MLTVATWFPLQQGFCLPFVSIQPLHRRLQTTHVVAPKMTERHSNMAECLNYHSTLETHATSYETTPRSPQQRGKVVCVGVFDQQVEGRLK